MIQINIILGWKWLAAQWCTDQGLAWQKEWSDPCQFSQNGKWHLLLTLQHSFQEGKGAGDGNWGIHIRNRIAQFGKSKKKKRQWIWKKRLGLLLGGSCMSKFEVLGTWTGSFYRHLTWPFRRVWHRCSFVASLSALPSFGSHCVLHFLALWWPFPVPFRLLFLHSSYMSLISQTWSRFLKISCPRILLPCFPFSSSKSAVFERPFGLGL